MKKFILITLIALMSFSVVASMAASKKKVVTTEFKTDIDCEHCVKKVLNFMPFQKGVKDVEVDLPTKVITVSYDAKKSSNEAIVKLFAKIDVEAKVVEEPEDQKE